ncbi:MAG: DUF4349 domain-containing protein [Cyanobacteria bacterium P01_D01_bin.123]
MGWRGRWLGSLTLAAAVLSGCGAIADVDAELSQALEADAVAAIEAPAAALPSRSAGASAPLEPQTSLPSDIPNPERHQTGRSQLVRRAELSLTVESVPAALQAIDNLLQRQAGDVLEMNHGTPVNANSPQQAWLQLRVPQNRLDSTIVELHALGEVKHQSMSAEDVSAQLVDYEARLTNLRQAETTVLQIMERSGKVGEVLEVARELSRIRESIERIEAQRTNLSNRVAYSTIHLNLESAAMMSASNLPGQHLVDTWRRATQSVGQFSLQLLSTGIWAIAYSPYLLAAVLCGYAIRAKVRR